MPRIVSNCEHLLTVCPFKYLLRRLHFTFRLQFKDKKLTCFNSLISRLATVANTKLSNLSLDRHISEPKISRLLFSQRTCLKRVLSNLTLYRSPSDVHTGYKSWTSLYTRMSCKAPILAEPMRSNSCAMPSRRGLTKSSRRRRNCTSK